MKLNQLKNFIRYLDDLFYDNFGPIRILFVIRNNLGLCCLIPIINEVKKYRNIRFSITIENIGEQRYSIDHYDDSTFKKSLISNKMSVFLKWHYIFFTDTTDLHFKRNATSVFTLHGNAYGNLDFDKENVKKPYIKYLLFRSNAPSLYFNNAFGDYNEMRQLLSMSKGAKGEKEKQFFISGLARIDQLVSCSEDVSIDFMNGIKCSREKKTIVINSHWTEKSLFKSLGSEFIETICNELGSKYKFRIIKKQNWFIH